MDENLSLTLHVEAGADVSAEERAALSRRLRQELLELSEVERADFAEKPAPSHTRTGNVAEVTQIILALIASGGVATTAITAVVTLAQAWIKRNEGRNIIVEYPNGVKLALNSATPEEVQKLTTQAMDYQRGFTPRGS